MLLAQEVTMKKVINIFLGIILGAFLVSCSTIVVQDVWESAVYTESQELGTGEKTITVYVIAEEKTVEFTVHTDKETLGEALIEHNLIAGENSSYGLYVKEVNGIYADYNTTKSYWGINKNGESLMTGVDAEKITDGDEYEFVYTKN